MFSLNETKKKKGTGPDPTKKVPRKLIAYPILKPPPIPGVAAAPPNAGAGAMDGAALN